MRQIHISDEWINKIRAIEDEMDSNGIVDPSNIYRVVADNLYFVVCDNDFSIYRIHSSQLFDVVKPAVEGFHFRYRCPPLICLCNGFHECGFDASNSLMYVNFLNKPVPGNVVELVKMAFMPERNYHEKKEV